jgi:hypothetical protein
MSEQIEKSQADVDLKNKQSGNILVKPKDLVTVVWGAESKFHKEGETSVVHRFAAEKLVKAGKCKISRKKDD